MVTPLPTAPTRNRGEPTEASGATYFGPWCNGSTSDFDSLGLGSTPSGPANQQDHARLLQWFGEKMLVVFPWPADRAQ